MAKSDKNKMTSTGLERPKKKKGKKIIIVIVILALAGAAFVFRKPILDMARKIPVINRVLPASEEVEEELSQEELLTINKEYESNLEKLTKELEELKIGYTELESRNEILQQYEDEYLKFITQKEEWDFEIANENPELYISYYEEIYPQTASEIYKVLKDDMILTTEQQETIKAVQNMDSEQAAKALEVLLSKDIDIVKIIMTNMKGDKKSEILDNMNSESAATVIKLILPWEGGN